MNAEWRGPMKLDASEHTGTLSEGGEIELKFPCENCCGMIEVPRVEIPVPSMVANSMSESEAEGESTAWCGRCETEIDLYVFNQNGPGFAIRADYNPAGKNVRKARVAQGSPPIGSGVYRVLRDRGAD